MKKTHEELLAELLAEVREQRRYVERVCSKSIETKNLVEETLEGKE